MSLSLVLEATSDEAVSIICTFVYNTIPSTFGEVDVHELYYTDWPGALVGHPADALAVICLWIL